MDRLHRKLIVIVLLTMAASAKAELSFITGLGYSSSQWDQTEILSKANALNYVLSNITLRKHRSSYSFSMDSDLSETTGIELRFEDLGASEVNYELQANRLSYAEAVKFARLHPSALQTLSLLPYRNFDSELGSLKLGVGPVLYSVHYDVKANTQIQDLTLYDQGLGWAASARFFAPATCNADIGLSVNGYRVNSETHSSIQLLWRLKIDPQHKGVFKGLCTKKS